MLMEECHQTDDLIKLVEVFEAIRCKLWNMEEHENVVRASSLSLAGSSRSMSVGSVASSAKASLQELAAQGEGDVAASALQPCSRSSRKVTETVSHEDPAASNQSADIHTKRSEYLFQTALEEFIERNTKKGLEDNPNSEQPAWNASAAAAGDINGQITKTKWCENTAADNRQNTSKLLPAGYKNITTHATQLYKGQTSLRIHEDKILQCNIEAENQPNFTSVAQQNCSLIYPQVPSPTCNGRKRRSSDMAVLSVNAQKGCTTCCNLSKMEECQQDEHTQAECPSTDLGKFESLHSYRNQLASATNNCQWNKHKSNIHQTDKEKQKSTSKKRTINKSHRFECHKVRWVCNDCRNIYFKCIDTHPARRNKKKLKTEDDVITEHKYGNKEPSKGKTNKSSCHIETESRACSEKSDILDDLKYEIVKQREVMEKMMSMWGEMVVLLRNFSISPHQQAQDEAVQQRTYESQKSSPYWQKCFQQPMDISNEYCKEKVDRSSSPSAQAFVPPMIIDDIESSCCYPYPNMMGYCLSTPMRPRGSPLVWWRPEQDSEHSMDRYSELPERHRRYSRRRYYRDTEQTR